MDANNSAEYLQLLDRLPLFGGLVPEEVERVSKYAFHFFFRRVIDLPFIREDLTLPVDQLEALGPGRFMGLDVI